MRASLAAAGLLALLLTGFAPGLPPGTSRAREAAFQSEPGTDPTDHHEFYFTRAIYSGFGRGVWNPSWAVDYPKADRQFLVGLRRLTNVDAFEMDHAVRLDDPEINRFPFLYALEVGYMRLTPPEVAGLRRYLKAGGFLMIDDFHGSYEWLNFEEQIRQVLPEYRIVDIPLDHPVFNSVYKVKEVIQVPVVARGCNGGPTFERDGYNPAVRGIFDEHQRLLVVINWNTDLGDAWEWAEQACYPLKYSTYAWEVGINFIIYGMSH